MKSLLQSGHAIERNDLASEQDVADFAQDERRFVKHFAASDQTTRAVLADLDSWLESRGVDADDRASTELVMAEALNNINEHAYHGKGGPVELVVTLHPPGLDCLLSDRGDDLPGASLPGGQPPPVDQPEDLPEGGFGWHIIRCLANEVCFRRENGWNRLSFRVVFAGLA